MQDLQLVEPAFIAAELLYFLIESERIGFITRCCFLPRRLFPGLLWARFLCEQVAVVYGAYPARLGADAAVALLNAT